LISKRHIFTEIPYTHNNCNRDPF